MRDWRPDYSSQQYERPNQPWICGLSEEGPACAAGPTLGGGCPAMGECTPVRDGDRWRCNRSTLRGGECDHGPTPEGACGRVQQCRPVRSLRAQRGRFVTATTVFAAGVLIVALSSDRRDEVISPGPLARAHAQLTARDNAAAQCAACHAAAERGVAGWAAAALVGHGERATQSEQCLACHDQSIARDLAMAAHNVPAEMLTPPGSRALGATGHEAPACATCHREHRGSDFNLTAMDNVACQACHQQRFSSFADDHPDFGVWPYVRRTRIAFNHASHQAKHFAERKQTFDCRTCHVEDASRHMELLVDYQAACAACHDEKIATSVGKGIPMLVLPTLDVEALKAAGHDIGAWPAGATGDFDGRLPPTMKLLLASEPQAAKAMATLGADFDFLDVDPDDEKQLVACADLAAAIKVLLTDLNQRGPAAVRERLSAVLQREVSAAQLDALVAGLSADTVRGAVAAWFPNGDAAKSPWGDRGVGPDSRVPPSERAASAESKRRARLDARDERSAMLSADPAFGPAGAWTWDDATFSIRYRPAAHADPVLASWLSLLAASPSLKTRPLELALFKELSKPTAAGLCVSCHSVEAHGGGPLMVNWRAAGGDRNSVASGGPSRKRRGFTKFAHGPHLLLPQLGECTSCHAIDESLATGASYADWNPHTFASEFRSLSKRQCAECHTARAAGDACQSCHHYHVNDVETWRVDR